MPTTPVTKQQLLDASVDTDVLAQVMNSEADSVTTRLGTTIPTMKKALELATGPAGAQGPRGVPGPASGSPDGALPINIFDINAVNPFIGLGVNALHGGLDATGNSSSFSTDFMHLRGATQWVSNIGIWGFFPTLGIAYYDVDKTFISGVNREGADGPATWPSGTPLTAPDGAVYVRFTWLDGQIEAEMIPPGTEMVLAGPVIPSVFQPYDADSQYGAGGVLPGTQLRLAFYKHAGATVTDSAITTDTTGVNLTVPGVHTTAQIVNNGAVVQPSGPVGDGLSHSHIQDERTSTITGSGLSLGNVGGWSTAFGSVSTLDTAVRGIHQSRSAVLHKHAVGDVAGMYSYVYTDGGISAQSDEGQSGTSIQLIENPDYFHGTVNTTTGQGDRNPALAFVSGNNWTTDGAYLLNISKGTISGKMTGNGTVPAPLSLTSGVVNNAWLRFIPVDATLPISDACGMVTASIANRDTTADTPVLTSVTVALALIGGVRKLFTVGGHVSVAGSNYPEQSFIETAVDNGDGTQTLGLKLRNPNGNAAIFQGGIAGQYISFDANLALTGVRSSYFAFGSLNGHDLIYGFQVVGGMADNSLPQLGNEAATCDGGASSGFHLYPGAEVVGNASMGAVPTLEPNNVVWAHGDVVENPHFGAFSGGALFLNFNQETPSPQSSREAGAIGVNISGNGFGGVGARAIAVISNRNAAHFKGGGGPIQEPDFIVAAGSFLNGLSMGTAPGPGGAIIFVQANTTVGGVTNIISLNYAAGGNMFFDPATGTWHVDGKYQAPQIIADQSVKSPLFSASTTAATSSVGYKMSAPGLSDTTLIAFGTDNAATIAGVVGMYDLVRDTYVWSFNPAGDVHFNTPVNGGNVAAGIGNAAYIKANGDAGFGVVQANLFKAGEAAGVTGTFMSADGKEVFVTNGIVTAIV